MTELEARLFNLLKEFIGDYNGLKKLTYCIYVRENISGRFGHNRWNVYEVYSIQGHHQFNILKVESTSLTWDPAICEEARTMILRRLVYGLEQNLKTQEVSKNELNVFTMRVLSDLQEFEQPSWLVRLKNYFKQSALS